MKVWLDGRITEPQEARIPVTDHGLLYGDGVFEGMRVYGRSVFRMNDHLRRISAGARSIGLEIPGGVEALHRIVLETARAHGRDEAYLRLIVTRGDGALGVDPTICQDPRIICIADDVRLYPADKLAQGIDMVTASVRKPALDAVDPRVKSLNYLNSVLAKREAKLRGADEALILNANGLVAEASVANLFAVRDGTLSTPPPNDGSLAGITRDSVLQIARAENLPTQERSLSRQDLFAADEIFLTGTGARIVAVATLDGAAIGQPGSRPVTTGLSKSFGAFVRDHGTPL